MKKIAILILIFAILISALILAKNLIAKGAITAAVKAVTGLRLTIDSFNVGILKSNINIEGLMLYNPEGFQDKIMVNMPQIYVDYDLGDFLKGKVHLEELKIHLEELIVIKNSNGELNLNSLKVVQERKREKETSSEEKKAKEVQLQIDSLKLKIGKVIYKDYSSPPRVHLREYKVNINEKYTNITDMRTAASLIIVRALMNTAIASLTDFDVGLLKDSVGDVLRSASKVAIDAAGKVVDVGRKAKDTTSEAIGKTADRIKDIFPFGR
ncbi:MAG: AsmA family protein [Candidatus Omnitrophota bacterium]